MKAFFVFDKNNFLKITYLDGRRGSSVSQLPVVQERGPGNSVPSTQANAPGIPATPVIPTLGGRDVGSCGFLVSPQ